MSYDFIILFIYWKTIVSLCIIRKSSEKNFFLFQYYFPVHIYTRPAISFNVIRKIKIKLNRICNHQHHVYWGYALCLHTKKKRNIYCKDIILRLFRFYLYTPSLLSLIKLCGARCSIDTPLPEVFPTRREVNIGIELYL